MDEAPYSAAQLRLLAEAITVAETEHHQNILLRESFDHLPVGCSCGATYRDGFEWEESKDHLREVMARAMLGALHRPCESCLGSGVWQRLRRDYECPECGGRGRTLTPLPAMTFQDETGDMWVVERLEGRGRDFAWAQVYRDA